MKRKNIRKLIEKNIERLGPWAKTALEEHPDAHPDVREWWIILVAKYESMKVKKGE
jgi:hypothetical protein